MRLAASEMTDTAIDVRQRSGMFPRLISRIEGRPLLRNFASMGAAQLAIRVSRLAATVILSRLLLPHDYGLAAIVLTTYEFVALFTRNGISAKVVQARPDEVELVALTAHRLTWMICLGLMVVQILIAWPVAWIYQDQAIALPIAAMSIIYLATPLSNIQAAFQQREARLGRIALASVAQAIVDNLLTIIFALMNMGLWAIILPKIIVAPIWLVLVRSGHPWRAKPIPGRPYLLGWRDIMRFSRNVLGVEFLTTLQSNIDNLLVGLFLGAHALGLYFFAFNGGLGITMGLIGAAATAVYPHLCAVARDPQALKARYFSSIRTLGMILVPLILLQASAAPLYVPVIFGETWSDAIPVLSIICLSALARPFAAVTSQLLKAIGRPDIELRWQAATTLCLVAALVCSAQFSLMAVAVAVLIVQSVGLGLFSIHTAIMVFRPHTRVEDDLPSSPLALVPRS